MLKKIFTYLVSTKLWAWLFPVLLIVPNVALAFTERDPFPAKITDIILPLGVYCLLMSLSRRVGRTMLWFLPVMIFAAFQIVLLYLYGESIIAIDMFLNVATTNVAEVSELLGNLTLSILIVVALYLPPIIIGIIMMVKKRYGRVSDLIIPRRVGIVSAAIGIILLMCCYIFIPGYAVTRMLFPVNVMSNLITAITRSVDTSKYYETSADFSFGSQSEHPDSLREIYVIVIGETARADNWQLGGYCRETNPRLAQRDELVFFNKTLSESNTTHKSVPMLLTHLSAVNFGDSIRFVKGVIDAFAEAGYSTAFISNQERNHSYIDFLGTCADTVDFARQDHGLRYDSRLVNPVNDVLAKQSASKKELIVIHTYGSHFNYRERYDETSARFLPDNATEATSYNRRELINAYDNTIVETDALLDSLMCILDADSTTVAALIYTSDHGEDIFDDSRERFLHASPTPTFRQIHVPMIVWLSSGYRRLYPDAQAALKNNSDRNVSSSLSLFPTIISLAGLKLKHNAPSSADLSSHFYNEPKRMYLNDYNEGLKLKDAGWREVDYVLCKDFGISYE